MIAETLGPSVAGEKVHQLVAEDAGTAGLEEDEGEAGVDLRAEVAEDFFEIAFCGREQAEVVKWAPAANMLARDFKVEARDCEDLCGGPQGLWMVVVVPRIRPKD